MAYRELPPCLALHLITAVHRSLGEVASAFRGRSFVEQLAAGVSAHRARLPALALGRTGAAPAAVRVRSDLSQAAVVLAAFIAGLSGHQTRQAALGSETVRKLTEAARVTGAGQPPFSRGHSGSAPALSWGCCSAYSFGEVGISLMPGSIAQRTNTLSLKFNPFRAATERAAVRPARLHQPVSVSRHRSTATEELSFHISQRFIDELLEEDCPYMD
ncbi:MAG: molybdenum ABC transporter permease [Bilophila wadsworthia]